MNIAFINNVYTVDGLMLPKVHFESKDKEIANLIFNWINKNFDL